MADKKVFQGDLSGEEVERREIYLSTYQRDAAESFKQLFTLSSGALIFFGTFAKDKLFDLPSKQMVLYLAVPSYVLLAVSLVLCTFGLYLLQCAAEKATNLKLWDYRFSLGKYRNYDGTAQLANFFLEGAGISFILALLGIGAVMFTRAVLL